MAQADEVKESAPEIDVTSVEDVTPNEETRNLNAPGKVMSKSSLISPSHHAMSAGGVTSKRQKKIEYTPALKIKIWEEMQAAYIRQSMSALGDIKHQRDIVIDSLNNSQY